MFLLFYYDYYLTSQRLWTGAFYAYKMLEKKKNPRNRKKAKEEFRAIIPYVSIIYH